MFWRLAIRGSRFMAWLLDLLHKGYDRRISLYLLFSSSMTTSTCSIIFSFGFFSCYQLYLLLRPLGWISTCTAWHPLDRLRPCRSLLAVRIHGNISWWKLLTSSLSALEKRGILVKLIGAVLGGRRWFGAGGCSWWLDVVNMGGGTWYGLAKADDIIGPGTCCSTNNWLCNFWPALWTQLLILVVDYFLALIAI